MRTMTTGLPRLLALLACLALTVPAFAQAPATTGGSPVSAPADLAAIDQVIELLRDDGRRNGLLEQLETLRAARADDTTAAEGDAQADAPAEIVTQEGVIGAITASIADSVGDVSTATFGIPIEDKLRRASDELGQRAANLFGGERLVDFLTWAAPGVLLALGVFAGLSRLPLVRRGQRFERRPDARGLAFVRLAIPRLLFGLVPVVAAGAFASAYAALFAPGWRESQIFAAVLSPFVAALLARRLVFFVLLLLGPTRGWRIVGYASRRFMPWITALAALAALANVLREFQVRVLLGTNLADVLAVAVDLALACVTAVFVVLHRATVRTLLLRGRRSGDVRDSRASGALAGAFELVAKSWHLVALAFVAANVAARVFGLGRGSFIWESTISVFWLVGGFLLLAVLNWASSRVARRLDRGKPSVRRAVLRRYVDILHVIVQIVVVAWVLLWILDTWGFAVSGWLSTDAGRRLARPLASLVIVPALIYALWTTLDTAITSAMAPQNVAGGTRERSARVRTLLPLVRNLLFVVLVAIAAIAVLANIGIDVLPLLAGAGVVGLAFSLGAQQLVKDVIAGFFIIFEDTIAIGDQVTTGDKSGTVEGITIRTMRLRESSGAVHSIPFGQIATLRNDSRGFGTYPLKIAVSSHCNVEDAMEAVRSVGRDLWSEPDFRRRMLAPPLIFGIDAIGTDSFTLTGEIRCQPLEQAGVGREFLRRLKQRFEERELVFA